MNDVMDSLRYCDIVADMLRDGVCPVTVSGEDDFPWVEYCGNPLDPGTSTCPVHSS